MKPLSTFILLLSSISYLEAEPNGKYCGNIAGNSISVFMNQTSHNANISANLFGTDFRCPSESYNFSNNMIKFSQNKTSCFT